MDWQSLAGEVVWIRKQPWHVVGVRTGQELIRLTVAPAGRPGAALCAFLAPVDAVFHCERQGRPRRKRARCAMAILAGRLGRLRRAHTPWPSVGARADVLPYQLEPALAVQRGARRVLIADAVGLGKTVEAGLIIATLMDGHAEVRVLALVPAPLGAQWADELAQRFGVTARVAGAAAFARHGLESRYLANPWLLPGVWIASVDYVKQPHVLAAMPPAPWDLLVVDEAHGVTGDSERHRTVEAIARTSRHVVLLSATPHDGDEARFRRLLNIGAIANGSIAHHPIADELVVFRRTRETLALDTSRRVSWQSVRLSVAGERVLAGLLAFERAAGRTITAAHRDAVHLVCSVLRKRAVSSMSALEVSLQRRLDIVTKTTDDDWEQPTLFDLDVVTDEERRALAADVGLPAGRERVWLARLLHLAHAAAAHERKVERLVRLIRRAREPVVVFTEYRDSLAVVVQALEREYPLAILHGGLSAPEHRRSLRRFLSGEATVLVATDVASQGLNLQSRTRWVISFDLPWTPMRLEQRIGRVDRIGQSRRVHATLLVARHAADAEIRARLTARADLAAHLSLASSAKWTRLARHLALVFARQRALAARWRGPEPTGVAVAPLARSPLARHAGPHGRLAIYEVPLVTATGTVIEQRIVCVQITGMAGASAEGAEAAAHAVIRRAASLARRAPAHAALVIARERALGARVSPSVPPGRGGAAGDTLAEIQPQVQAGLFDRRHEAHAEVAAAIAASREAAIARARSDATIRAGQPRLIMVLE